MSPVNRPSQELLHCPLLLCYYLVFFHSSIIFVNMVYAANWHRSKDFLLTYPKVPACAQVILYPLILLTNKGYSYFLETKKKIYVLAVHLTDNTKYTLRARTLSLVSFW